MADYGELGYLMRQRQPARNAGASELGWLLGGGNKAHERQIYEDSAARVGRMEEVLAKARAATRENMARESLATQADKTGDSELAMLIRAAHELNPNTYYESLGHKQGNEYQKKAWELAQAPNRDWGALNADLAVIGKKPVMVQRTLGAGTYTPNAFDPNSVPVTSELGQAMISLHGAQAGAANAAAAQHYASAGLARARTDEVTGKGAAGSKVKPLTSEMTKAFFTDPDTGKLDTNLYRDYVATLPKLGMQDSPEALQKYHTGFANVQAGDNTAPAPVGVMDSLGALFGGGKSAPAQPAPQAPAPGARQAADGKWYVPDANRPGKYLRVDQGRQVVRTGTSADGKRVAQYDDGTVDYAGQ